MGRYLIISDFRRGLDPRKLSLGAPAGTLVELLNGHLTNAADIEKRKAFTQHAFSSGHLLDDNGDQGTFGLIATATGLTVFGSAGLNGSAPAYSQPELAQDLPTVDPPVSYQKLTHPAVLEGTTYDRTKHRMKALVHAELFGGDIQAVATFADGRTFGYSNGALVEDYAAGLVLPHLNSNAKIATHLVRLTNLSNHYSAAIVAGVGNEHKLDLTGPLGVDFDLSVTKETAAGTTSGPTVQTQPVAPRDGIPAAGAFRITQGKENAASLASATGTLTRNATNAVAGDYVTLGNKRYTFRASITATSLEGSVLIGASASASLTNLAAAINHTGTPGTDYKCQEAHPWVTGAIAGSALNLTAFAGTSGNSCALSRTPIGGGGITGWTVSGAVFTGGAGTGISSVRVIAPNGSHTELFAVTGLVPTGVDFDTNPTVTAAAVADAINANTGTSGYTASSDDNQVSVFSADDASPMPNAYVLAVACGGEMVVGDCSVYFVMLGSSGAFTLSSLIVGGKLATGNLIASTAYPQAGSIDTFPELYANLVSQINAGSGSSGVVAWAAPDHFRLAALVTRSDDVAAPVFITPADTSTVGITYGLPPTAPVALSVTVPELLYYPLDRSDLPAPGVIEVNTGEAAVAAAKGGSGIYTYAWVAENNTTSNHYLGTASNGAPFDMWADQAQSIATRFGLGFSLNPQGLQPGGYTTVGQYAARFVCKVTDSYGAVAYSNTLTVIFIVSAV